MLFDVGQFFPPSFFNRYELNSQNLFDILFKVFLFFSFLTVPVTNFLYVQLQFPCSGLIGFLIFNIFWMASVSITSYLHATFLGMAFIKLEYDFWRIMQYIMSVGSISWLSILISSHDISYTSWAFFLVQSMLGKTRGKTDNFTRRNLQSYTCETNILTITKFVVFQLFMLFSFCHSVCSILKIVIWSQNFFSLCFLPFM